MQVTIVQSKNKCEMTLEELAETDKQIGWLQPLTGTRYFCLYVGTGGFIIVNLDGSGRHKGVRLSDPQHIESCLSSADSHGTFHVFDIARELYLWMSEEKQE